MAKICQKISKFCKYDPRGPPNWGPGGVLWVLAHQSMAMGYSQTHWTNLKLEIAKDFGERVVPCQNSPKLAILAKMRPLKKKNFSLQKYLKLCGHTRTT